jgi:DNA-directed RNA polymerase alpha subunit
MKMTFEFDNFDELYAFCEMTLDRKLTEKQMAELLNKPIKYLGLSGRAKAVLEATDIKTIGDLTKLTEFELVSMPGMGWTSKNQIVISLHNNGLRLREEE